MLLLALARRAVLACALAAPTPRACLSSRDHAPRRLVQLDRCPGACTLELADLATVSITLRFPF